MQEINYTSSANNSHPVVFNFNKLQRERSFHAKTWYELCEKKINLREGVEFLSLDEVPMESLSQSSCRTVLQSQ